MSTLDNVREHLKKYGLDQDIIIFDQDSGTVTQAAAAAGTTEAEIAKSLSFRLKKTGEIVVVVLAGDAQLDNKKFRHYFGSKGSMVEPDQTYEVVGHDIGGVCPWALRDGVKVYLDVSMKRFEQVLPACGSNTSAIRISIPDLERSSDFVDWVDIAKGWQEEEQA